MTIILTLFVVLCVLASERGIIGQVVLSPVAKETYDDSISGFSFKYPAYLNLCKSSYGNQNDFIDLMIGGSVCGQKYRSVINIVVEKGVSTKDVKMLAKNYLDGFLDQDTNINDLRQVDIGSMKGYQYTWSNPSLEDALFTIVYSNNNLIVIEYNQKFYAVSETPQLVNYSSYLKTYNDLISSLSFGASTN